LGFVLRQLVLAASADTGFALTIDDRDRFERGTGLVLDLLNEHSAAIVDLAYRDTRDEHSSGKTFDRVARTSTSE
jgi:hypothetical protein